MAKFRKDPIVVDAVQFTGQNSADIHEFCGKSVHEPVGENYMVIDTKEGKMKALPGDWVIKEPFPSGDRDFYPCKPDLFENTYSPVSKRYFVVFYKSGSVSLDSIGHINVTVTPVGDDPVFLNQKQLIEEIQSKSPKNKIVIITNFIELKEWEYNIWIE